MKKFFTSVVGLVSGIGVAGLYIIRHIQIHTNKMLTTVSDAGYETAPDILFPKDESREKNLRLGPVIPE